MKLDISLLYDSLTNLVTALSGYWVYHNSAQFIRFHAYEKMSLQKGYRIRCRR